MSSRDPLYDTGSTSDVDPFGQPSRQGSSDADATDTARQQGEQLAGTMSDKYQEAADQARQKSQELAQSARQATEQAQQKADQGMDKAASGLDQAAETLRQQGEQRGGGVGKAATRAAGTLDSASQYLRDKDTEQLLDDLESLVRRKPVESLLTAAGIGFVLSKLFR